MTEVTMPMPSNVRHETTTFGTVVSLPAPSASSRRRLVDRLFDRGLALLVVTTVAAVCACMMHL